MAGADVRLVAQADAPKMMYTSANGDLFGWIFAAILLVGTVLLGATSTRNPPALFAFFTTVLARVVLSALSSFNIFLPPEADRLDFHIQASQLATSSDGGTEFVVGHQVYTSALSYFYQLFGTSIFLGCIISIVPFVFSQIYVVKFLKLWGLERHAASTLLMFGFAPAMLLYDNFTYREPTQILCMTMALYHATLFRRTGAVSSLALCSLALVVFAALHAKFIVVIPIVLVLLFFWPQVTRAHGAKRNRGGSSVVSAVAGVVLLGLSIAAVGSQSGENSLVDVISNGSVGDYMSDMKNTMQGIAPRTMLPLQIDSSNPLVLAYMAPLVLLQYMFAPIVPWLVQEPQDAVALFDTALRTLLLISAIRSLRASPPAFRNEKVLLLVIYIVFSLVAALGTAAVGTVIRHQIKVSWVLVVIGAPGLITGFVSMFSGRRTSARTSPTRSTRQYRQQPWSN